MNQKALAPKDDHRSLLEEFRLRVERLRSRRRGRRARQLDEPFDELTRSLWDQLCLKPQTAFFTLLRTWADAEDGPIADEAARTLSMFAKPQDGPRIARMIRTGSSNHAMNLLEAASYFGEDESFDKALFAAAKAIVLGKCHAGIEDEEAQREAIQFIQRVDAKAARTLFSSKQFWKPGNVATYRYASWLLSQPEANRAKLPVDPRTLSRCEAWVESRVVQARTIQERFQLRHWLYQLYRMQFR